MSDTGITVTETKSGKRYRAEVWDRVAQRRMYRTFPTRAAAKSWRTAMEIKIRNGEVHAVDPVRFEIAAEEWLKRARAGVARNRSGTVYKPSVLRGYEQKLRLHIYPAFGHLKLTAIRVSHVQALIDKLIADGASPSAVRNTVVPIRVVFRDAQRRELVQSNPCDPVALPSGGTPRERIATVAEAIELLNALEPKDRPVWATAFFGGLRRGELAALRWSDVDLEAGTISVTRSYDEPSRQFVAPKSRKGNRVVPIPGILRPYLDGDHDGELCFGGARPYSSNQAKLAKVRWAEAGLNPINLHECRHTYASLMIAAGVNVGTVSDYMGHSTVAITLDRYRHLLPGNAVEAMGLLNAYIDENS